MCSIKFENPCETVWERRCVTNFIADCHVTHKKDIHDIVSEDVPDKEFKVVIVLHEKLVADSYGAGRT